MRSGSKWRPTAAGLLALAGIAVAACSTGQEAPAEEVPVATQAPLAEPTPTPPEQTATPSPAQAAVAPEVTSTPVPTVTSTTVPPTRTSQTSDTVAELFRAGIDAGDWSTNFAKHSVPYSEIFSGGVPKDGIPAIDNPKFISVVEADKWLEDAEPVLIFEHGGDVRAYPAQIMIWHEIVNDIVGGRPVAVTYCPLCNTAITFDATIDGRRQTFGTTGNLRFSDLVMYDRETESWWQQITGEAIVGARTGSDLTFLPSPMISWAEFKESHADGKVLSRDTGFSRSYGVNPYTGYDTSAPFLFSGPEDDRLPLTERVAGVVVNDDSIAFPFSELAKASVVHSTVGGKDIVVFYKKGTASALDARTISEGRDVGSTGVFLPEVDGKKLTFESADGSFVDRETGTRWNILGQGTEGELKGKKLEPVVHANHFWFSWAVFKPDTKVFKS